VIIFQWDDCNVFHIGEHGVTPDEAKYVIDHARSPYPEERPEEKLLVWGQTEAGRYLQVVFVYLEDDEVDVEALTTAERLEFQEGKPVAYVVHARDLTDAEKRQLRRRTKR